MASKTATDPAPKDIPLTLEDVALLADGTGDLPDGTATRLQALILCNDLKRLQHAWRRIASHLASLRQMAEDAGVKLLVDGLYAFRALEQLRSQPWETIGDVLDPHLDVLYKELIAMAGAMAERAEGAEKAELKQLIERLARAFGDQLGGQKLVEVLLDRLLAAGDEAAEEALGELVGMYRHRRKQADALRSLTANG